MKCRWLLLVFLFLLLHEPLTAQAEQLPHVLEHLSPQTRLIVFSPHPDDGELGVGGLIQRVLHHGGKVNVVYVTSGDGYAEGLALEEHLTHPNAQDFRAYGARRQEEVSRALAALGVPKQGMTFLGFPDRGLCPILRKYWTDHPPYYVSPYTQEDHPLSGDVLLPQIEYDGEDLTREIAQLLTTFRPTLIAVTHPQDQHPDHCATYFFVKRAVQQLEEKDPSWRLPAILTFLIHFNRWPVEVNADALSPLLPPPGFSTVGEPWIQFPLSLKERETKHQALVQHRSQMAVMGSYLLSFVRANELFLRDPLAREDMRSQHLCCGQ